MAIDTSDRSSAGLAGGAGPVVAPTPRPWWLRLNVITGLVGAVVGYALGHWVGNVVASGYFAVTGNGQNDVALLLGYTLGTVGWLAGLGIFNYPVQKMFGYQYTQEPVAEPGLARYFRYTLDHKVVGVQYLIGMLTYFATAGLLAMAIRTELLSPTQHILRPDEYLTVVGEHGTMMMMMMTSVIVGPFGNFLVPLMIGSRRMAFPRMEALSFWITPAAYIILLSGFLTGGFQAGWTGYTPLSIQTGPGQDAWLMAFGLMGISMVFNGINLITTVVNFRAPGMSWGRLSALTWSVVSTSFLFALAAPVLVAGCYMMGTDRSVPTAFFDQAHGGSSYLWENVFWFFGHPEVYILALPGFGIVGDILPVFCRKPLFAYRVNVAGMIGVAVLSFFVWQHHLFDSGINPDMRPVIMLTTELISIPTGFIFLVGLGTIWQARMRFEVPMLFAMAMYFNFLIGGISGVFVSDVPADATSHGSFFVMAHFHYTIMGGLMFAFFGGLYFWLPKMTGRMMDGRLGRVQFWLMFLAFNSTFLPLFAVGLLDQPRRVFTYAKHLQTLNDWVSISAFVLGFSILLYFVNFVWSTFVVQRPAPENPWDSLGLEWQVSSPPPPGNFARIPVVVAGPYDYGLPRRPAFEQPTATPVGSSQGV